jgi:hypothetical protein
MGFEATAIYFSGSAERIRFLSSSDRSEMNGQLKLRENSRKRGKPA